MRNMDLVEVNCNLCKTPITGHVSLLTAPLPEKTQQYFNGLTQTSFKICSNCSLAFLSPRPPERYFISFYNSGNRKKLSYNKIIEIEKSSLNYCQEIVEFLDKHLKISNRTSICDVGCGYGTMLSMLRDRYQANVVGLELSDSAVEFAKSHYELDVHQCLLEEMQNDQMFDLLTSIAVVEHLFDPMRTLEQFKNRVKIGGHVLIIVPDLESLDLNPFQGGRLQTVFKIVHLYYFTIKTMASMLKKIGMEPVASRKFSRIKKQGEVWIIARRKKSTNTDPARNSDWEKVYRYVRRKTLYARIFAFIERIGKELIGEKFARQVYGVFVKKS